MKVRTLGFVAGLGLLAPCAWGGDPPSAAQPALSDMTREVLRGFAYQVTPPPKLTAPVIAAKEPAADADSGAGIVQMPALQVTGKPDQTFSGVNAALAEEKRSIPCDLLVTNISPRFQLRDFGPPLPPLDVETPSERLEANFPLVTLVW
jgi:hypothetical protein